MAEGTVDVVVLEWEEPVGTALARWLSILPGLTCRGWIRSILGLARAIDEHHPDVVVMDLFCGEYDNLATVRDLSNLPGPAAPRVVILTASDNARDVDAALEAGVYGYVSKLENPREMVTAIRCAARQEVHLSPFTLEILRRDMTARAAPSRQTQPSFTAEGSHQPRG